LNFKITGTIVNFTTKLNRVCFRSIMERKEIPLTNDFIIGRFSGSIANCEFVLQSIPIHVKKEELEHNKGEVLNTTNYFVSISNFYKNHKLWWE
jgi:hypothetical protein